MALFAFNLVLTGESFPVASVDLRDFQFRHRAFRELVRLPVALQAEAIGGVRLQLFNDRFEVSVTEPDDVPIQIEGLIGLAETFQDYVGRRTIRQVGHNFTWLLNDTADRRERVFSSFVQRDALNAVIAPDGDELVGDVNLTFRRGRASRAALHIGMSQPADIALDFNFHYELSELDIAALEAASQMRESYDLASQIASGFEGLVARTEAVDA